MAGKAILRDGSTEWIRPVGPRPGGEVLLEERILKENNSKDPQPGDIILLTLKGKSRHDYQPENHTIDVGYYWVLEGRASWPELKSHVEPVQGDLWFNGMSGRYGINDKVPLDEAAKLGESLKLIRVRDLTVVIEHEWPDYDNKRRVRGRFSANEITYCFSITDESFRAHYRSCQDGEYEVGSAILCISLGQPHNGLAYKIIAAVIRKGDLS